LDCTTSENVELLQKRGALRRKSSLPLPRAVENVMGLTSLLRYKCLWVDRFCIVQNDGPNKAAELNKMGSIYGGAVATIVAARGRAFEGLVGIRGVTGARHLSASARKIPEGGEAELHGNRSCAVRVGLPAQSFWKAFPGSKALVHSFPCYVGQNQTVQIRILSSSKR